MRGYAFLPRRMPTFLPLCLILVVLLGLLQSLPAQAEPKERLGRQGLMSLKSWRLDLVPSIELGGEWLVYPGQLLSLADLSGQPIPAGRGFSGSLVSCSPAAPSAADSSQTDKRAEVQPPALIQACYATYVLELRDLPTQPLAVLIPELATAFRLSWNNEVIAQGGEVSTDPQQYKPYVGHRLADLHASDSRGVLVLQIANHAGALGAVRPLVLGDAVYMKARYAQGELLEALSAAIAGIGGLLLLLQQKARRRYEKGLWGLSLFSLAVMLYTLTEGYTVLSWFVAQPDWSLVVRINIASQHLFLPALTIWLSQTYAGMFPRWYCRLTLLQLMVLVPVLLLLPMSMLIALESPQMLLNLALGLLGFVFMLYYRFFTRQTPLYGLEVTLCLVLLPAIHDVLLYQHLIQGMDWLPIGFVAFIVAQIFLLAVQRAKQHAHLEGLNHRLEASQQLLEQRVDLRTKELREKVDQLEAVTGELRYLSRHDGLTSLMRQNPFLEACQQQLAAGTEGHSVVSLILLDLDRYKQIGAMFGPIAADQAMKDIGHLLEHWADTERLCARLEGESFALFVLGMDEEEAVREAELLRLRISQRAVMVDDLTDTGQIFHITASFGVCAFLSTEADIRTMINAAESALNRAKAKGRNCVIGYSHLPHIDRAEAGRL